MKAKDPNLWSQMTVELRATEEGKKFLDFFEFWFDAADRLIAEGAAGIDRIFTSKSTAVHYMREGLQLAEANFGFIDVDLIGQMLAVAAMYWTHGEELVAGLTFIEHRVLEESTGRKIGELERAAKLEGSDPKG